MDKADIDRMALEAGFQILDGIWCCHKKGSIPRFAALIRSAAMEEAAVIAEKTYEGTDGERNDDGCLYGENSADAIRAAALKEPT